MVLAFEDGKKQQIVCWTKMQTEAGQSLSEIVRRKEIERKACDNVFFWGVGNAPSRFVRSLAANASSIPVVFSTMKSQPKTADSRPAFLFVWRSYLDNLGTVRHLPAGSLVSSRYKGPNQRHYALICRSLEPLSVSGKRNFDHTAYRNLGPTCAQIASSQVTSLAVQVAAERDTGPYRRDLEATLHGAAWVKLLNPALISMAQIARLQHQLVREKLSIDDWIELVSELKESKTLQSNVSPCVPLFDAFD